jgi:hypothetical protein
LFFKSSVKKFLYDGVLRENGHDLTENGGNKMPEITYLRDVTRNLACEEVGKDVK